jgi:hypothetical protein
MICIQALFGKLGQSLYDARVELLDSERICRRNAVTWIAAVGWNAFI